MARKPNIILQGLRDQSERMYVSPDNTSVSRGRRVAPRTEVCRPCLIWSKSEPDIKRQGVVLDLNPYGLRIRMLEAFEDADSVVFQMMRDDEFQVPLPPPIEGKIRRIEQNLDGFFDHGVKVQLLKIKPVVATPPIRTNVPTSQRQTGKRMHMTDVVVGDRGVRRMGRGHE